MTDDVPDTRVPATPAWVAGSTPYPWPFDGVIDPAVTALVVAGADDQVASRTPSDPVADAHLTALRTALAAAGVLVVLVSHDVAHRCGPVEHPSPVLQRAAGDRLVTAAGLDGFYGSPLDRLLQREGRTHLLVTGRGLETAVHSTLRRANDRGYECLVVADACACGDASLRAASISSIEMSGGIFGAVANTAAVLAAYTPTLIPTTSRAVTTARATTTEEP